MKRPFKTAHVGIRVQSESYAVLVTALLSVPNQHGVVPLFHHKPFAALGACHPLRLQALSHDGEQTGFRYVLVYVSRVQRRSVRLVVLRIELTRLNVHHYGIDIRVGVLGFAVCEFYQTHPVRTTDAVNPNKGLAIYTALSYFEKTTLTVILELIIGQPGCHPVIDA